MSATNGSGMLPSSDLLFDPSGDRLALGNCTPAEATSCPQCGECTCTYLEKQVFTIGACCPLHGKNSFHPMEDVYDEPRILAALTNESSVVAGVPQTVFGHWWTKAADHIHPNDAGNRFLVEAVNFNRLTTDTQ